MKRIFLILVGLGAWLLISEADLGPLLSQQASSDPLIRKIPTVAGMPYEKALAIVDRHEKELRKILGVEGAALGKDEIVVEVTVYTNEKGEKPATLPAELRQLPKVIEGIPVRLFAVYVFPPPPGVIVLRPGGTREHAAACPPRFSETKSDHRRLAQKRTP